MPSKYPYQYTIRNEFLGVSKVIRAMTAEELEWLIEAQLVKWGEQELRKRRQAEREIEREIRRREQAEKAQEREANRLLIEELRAQAEDETANARNVISVLRSVLSVSLEERLIIDWDELLDNRSFPEIKFDHPKPDRDQIRIGLLGEAPTERQVRPPIPEKPAFLESILPFLRKRRLEREAKAIKEYEAEKLRSRVEFENCMKNYRAGEKQVVDAYNGEVRAYRYHPLFSVKAPDRVWRSLLG